MQQPLTGLPAASAGPSNHPMHGFQRERSKNCMSFRCTSSGFLHLLGVMSPLFHWPCLPHPAPTSALAWFLDASCLACCTPAALPVFLPACAPPGPCSPVFLCLANPCSSLDSEQTSGLSADQVRPTPPFVFLRSYMIAILAVVPWFLLSPYMLCHPYQL